ncbi:MAG TPA: Glu-tRNA(Gln) amidotransferase GatDE subunit E, partial [Euryarchaeota archaeon]|nr:Glu-tRNA(Gln) amidotransferase GatDE subunit E [Euryarchaeota archaeon]
GAGEEVEADARLFIERLVKERADLIKERGERAFSPLMGVVMREFRGRVDGGKLASWLKEEIERSLKGG